MDTPAGGASHWNLPLTTPRYRSVPAPVAALPMEEPFPVVNATVMWEAIFLMYGDRVATYRKGLYIDGR